MAQMFPVPPKKKAKRSRKPILGGPPVADVDTNPFAKKGPPVGRKAPPAKSKKKAPKKQAPKASGPSGVLGPPQIGSFRPPKKSAPKPPLGSGQRFDQLSSQLSKKPGVTNPNALAASIGRAKFGAKKFGQLAQKGKPGY